MPIPFHSRTVVIVGEDVVAEAVMNNCSDLWTATAKAAGRLVATAAGTTPEAALASAIAAAERKLEAARVS
jgi:hypothetical protein